MKQGDKVKIITNGAGGCFLGEEGEVKIIHSNCNLEWPIEVFVPSLELTCSFAKEELEVIPSS